MADDRETVLAIKELTNQVSRLAATMELVVLANATMGQTSQLSTCKTCGFRLMGPPNTTLTPEYKCPACGSDR